MVVVLAVLVVVASEAAWVAGRDTAKHSTHVLEVARHVLTGVESMVTDVNPLRSATNVPLRMLLVQAALR